MPGTNENEVPTPAKKKSRNERTEAKFLEDADKLIAEAARLGAEYTPPSLIAELVPFTSKRDQVRVQRTVHQANNAKEETARNRRERLYRTLRSDVGSLVEFTKAAGVPANDVDALRTIYRELRGERAVPIDPTGGGSHVSVAHTSYASLADNYARFIEQYAALDLKTTEAMYQVETHRARLAELRQANADVIASNAASDDSGELFDRLAYTAADSLLNSCVLSKSYIKSKFKTSGEPYKNISKTSFRIPSRLC